MASPTLGSGVYADPWTRARGRAWLSGSRSITGPREENQDTFIDVERFNLSLNGLSLNGEDADEVGLWAIFDGHRGMACAEFLKDNLQSYLQAALAEVEAGSSADDGDAAMAERALGRALGQLEAAFMEQGKDSGQGGRPPNLTGSTAIVALLVGEQLIMGQVGDSAAILARGRVAQALTEPHTPGNPVEKARIEACGGWVTTETELFLGQVHRMDLRDARIRDKASEKCRVVTIYRVCGQLAVSRAFGDADFKNFCGTEPIPEGEYYDFPDGHCQRFDGSLVSAEADIRAHALAAGDHFFLLACDGFWDVVSAEECVYFVWERLRERGVEPETLRRMVTKDVANAVATDLADLALRSGSSDNITVVIVFIDDGDGGGAMPSLAI